MKLSDLKDIGSFQIIKDCEFSSLGLLDQKNILQLSFLDDIKYLSEGTINSNLAGLITKKELISLLNIDRPLGLIISDNPRITFYKIHNYLVQNTSFYGKFFKSKIGVNTKIHQTAYISESNVTIGAGTVIGTDALECKRYGHNILPVIHAGGVLIHDNVEIKSNCCICKSVLGGYTEIGECTKIDNLVYIAHNTKIGKRCMIIGFAMISGSAIIGDDVWIGPNVTISNKIQIGNNAYITLGSVVTKNVLPHQRVTGNFAIDHEKFLKFIRKIR
jgi:UDP-3-O-[3-hydroxymyristoyl] glucosamine N-acyltransferase